MTEEETVEKMKLLMAEVYNKGFNIYQCINRLKKQIKLREDFPPQAIIWTCEEFLFTKKPIRNHYPWFIHVFTVCSERYFSEGHCKDSESRNKRGGFAQSIQQIMKGAGQ